MGKKKIESQVGYVSNMSTHTFFCYANSTDNNANNKVLKTFPGTIGVVNDEYGTIVLNPDYRSDTDELHYYTISQILAAINLTYTKFN